MHLNAAPPSSSQYCPTVFALEADVTCHAAAATSTAVPPAAVAPCKPRQMVQLQNSSAT